MKLMGACGFVLGVWPGLIQAVLSLSLAVLVGLVECRLQKQPLSAVRLPLAPFFCFGGVSAYWLTAFALSNLNKWRYQIEQEHFSEPDGHRRGVHPAGGSGLLWDHTAFSTRAGAQTGAVRVKAEVIPQGTYITADMVEVYTRGASGMEDSVATSLDEVVGRYTDVELRKNTDVNTAWLSSEPLTQYEYLTRLNGSKVAISVTIPTFAKGGSGKVEAGDIIMLFATDKDTGETTQPRS